MELYTEAMKVPQVANMQLNEIMLSDLHFIIQMLVVYQSSFRVSVGQILENVHFIIQMLVICHSLFRVSVGQMLENVGHALPF